MSHVNARKSNVPNLGEDIPGSARAVQGGQRSLEELEAQGIAEKEIKRDKLLKNYPPVYNEINIDTATLHIFLTKFPSAPSKHGAKHEVIGRKHYFEAYNTIKSHIEDAANNFDEETFDLKDFLSKLRNKVHDMIKEFREIERLCPAANCLCNYYSTLSSSGYRKKTILKEIKSLYESFKDDPSQEALENIVYKNMSVFKAFGNKKEIKKTIERKEMYGNSYERRASSKLEISEDKIDDKLMKMFKAVEYGNYVSDKERTLHKTLVIQAFYDLEVATGLDIKTLTGDKSLSIGFGSRGRGKALASYFPQYDIINLTRKNGFGSLSHEVGHFLDKQITRKHLPQAEFLTNTRISYMRKIKVDESLIEVLEGMSDINNTIRERLLKDEIFLLLSGGRMRYWLSGVEIFARAFECFVFSKLKDQGIENDYLSVSISSLFWPTREEMEIYTPLIEKYLTFI